MGSSNPTILRARPPSMTITQDQSFPVHDPQYPEPAPVMDPQTRDTDWSGYKTTGPSSTHGITSTSHSTKHYPPPSPCIHGCLSPGLLHKWKHLPTVKSLLPPPPPPPPQKKQISPPS